MRKTLIIDIETIPNLVHVWSLHGEQHIGLDQVIEPSRMLCFAAQWYGQPKVYFHSSWEDGQAEMVTRAWELLDQADVAMHYNGRRFDVPKINGEIKLVGLRPPSPFLQIDLWQTVRGFGWPSSKLEYALKVLGLPQKIQTGGHLLWRGCIDGDPKAQAKMRRYCIQDVKALGPLHDEIRPWIRGYPSFAAETGENVCPRCGSSNLQRRGVARTQLSTYQRFHCTDCGSWSRATKRDSGVSIREVAS